MVRPMKAVDIPKQPSNFRRVMKKPMVKNPEIEEKYKNHATMPLKKLNGPKIRTERDFSSQPSSFKKGDNVSKKTSPSTAESREVMSKSVTIPISPPSTRDGKRIFSAIRNKHPRTVSKNKIPAIAKSEPVNKIRKTDKELKKHKLKGKITSASPPAERYFKPEGKLKTTTKPSKIIGKLITPKLVEERFVDVEKELKSKFTGVNRVDHSNISLMAQYTSELKPTSSEPKKKPPKKLRKTKPPLRKIKKFNISKTDVKTKPSNKTSPYNTSEVLVCSSDEKQISVKEIKHNDSFVISAKKLLNQKRHPKNTKPEVIKLYKRSEKAERKNDISSLKPCLKKDNEGKPLQSFGVEGKKMQIRKSNRAGAKMLTEIVAL